MKVVDKDKLEKWLKDEVMQNNRDGRKLHKVASHQTQYILNLVKKGYFDIEEGE